MHLQFTDAKSKKNKKKNQANKQNADSGKAAENETLSEPVVEEGKKDELEGEDVNIFRDHFSMLFLANRTIFHARTKPKMSAVTAMLQSSCRNQTRTMMMRAMLPK